MTNPMTNRPHIVIVGAGFGGLSAALALAGAAVDVTVIDRRNYHLFQPLLYQVATAGAVAGPDRCADPRHPAQAGQRHACCSAGSPASTRRRRTVELDGERASPTTG